MDNDLRHDQRDQRPDQRAAEPRADETAVIPWARTTTLPTVDAPAQAAAVEPGHAGYAAPAGSAPAVSPPVWSGRKTAIAAALAIGFASVGAIGAAAVLPAGSAQTDQGGRGFPGGGRFQPGGGQFPGQNGQNQPGQQNQQGFPGQQNQQGFPGGQVPGAPGDDDDDHDDASTT